MAFIEKSNQPKPGQVRLLLQAKAIEPKLHLEEGDALFIKQLETSMNTSLSLSNKSNETTDTENANTNNTSKPSTTSVVGASFTVVSATTSGGRPTTSTFDAIANSIASQLFLGVLKNNTDASCTFVLDVEPPSLLKVSRSETVVGRYTTNLPGAGKRNSLMPSEGSNSTGGNVNVQGGLPLPDPSGVSGTKTSGTEANKSNNNGSVINNSSSTQRSRKNTAAAVTTGGGSLQTSTTSPSRQPSQHQQQQQQQQLQQSRQPPATPPSKSVIYELNPTESITVALQYSNVAIRNFLLPSVMAAGEERASQQQNSTTATTTTNTTNNNNNNNITTGSTKGIRSKPGTNGNVTSFTLENSNNNTTKPPNNVNEQPSPRNTTPAPSNNNTSNIYQTTNIATAATQQQSLPPSAPGSAASVSIQQRQQQQNAPSTTETLSSFSATAGIPEDPLSTTPSPNPNPNFIDPTMIDETKSNQTATTTTTTTSPLPPPLSATTTRRTKEPIGWLLVKFLNGTVQKVPVVYEDPSNTS
jgi:hypothetical protein